MGQTLDDACGEAFDKVAAMLGLPYPGGKHIDALAARGTAVPRLFPRPYVDNHNLDFSFSGLKTAVGTYLKKHPGLGQTHGGAQAPGALADVCASFTHSVVETLRIKVERALGRLPEVRALIVAGGVAANSFIRRSMAEVAERRGIELLTPSRPLCTDNGAMIAHAGELLVQAGLGHGLDLEAVPRGRVVPQDYLSLGPIARDGHRLAKAETSGLGDGVVDD